MANRPHVLLTRRIPEDCIARLNEESELTFNDEDRYLSKQEIIAASRHADGLICMLTDKIDDEVFAASPNLKVVANYAVGYDNIDVAAATRRNIAVTNTPDVLTDATADMAWALMFAIARRVVEADRFVRSGQWTGWQPLQMLGNEITGATLGLVGLGRIGRAVAERARAFRMKVLYWNRTRLDAESEAALGIEFLTLDEVIKHSDFVSLHVAFHEQTRHLIDRRRLELMKPTAYLINTARGAIVDEKELAFALKQHLIAGAGLDVFENEPLLEPELMGLNNAVIAPHLGSATLATRTKMGHVAIDNCLAACKGQRPPNLVTAQGRPLL